MSAQVFWAVFYSTQRPSQISPTADFDRAAIPPTIFSMVDQLSFFCINDVQAYAEISPLSTNEITFDWSAVLQLV